MADEVKSLSELGLRAQGGREARITGLSADSRQVKPGHLFAALPGTRMHGAAFIRYALRMEAAAILTDRAGAEIATAELAASDAALIVVEDPRQVTPAQMEAWVGELDSWDLCDQLCNNLFRKTTHARAKALAWAKRKPEFIRRAGFVLMATLAVYDKTATDADFEPFFAAIQNAATDERNFVRKAVNWALRQIGKRNGTLRKRAMTVAGEIATRDSKAARWIAADALRELRTRV